jgi:DNA (cytosine-5)-methyltransferase 1
LRDIDLFAGAGGLAIGLKKAGFAPVSLYEWDEFACQTLRQNITSNKPTLDGAVEEIDVHEIDWRSVSEPVRLLAAGAPCQPFSLGGRHLAEQDGRNLFPEVFRAVRALRPRTILLENVRGLIRPSFRPYFEYILRQLRFPSLKPRHDELWQEHDRRLVDHENSNKNRVEYVVTWKQVDAADYGVPQNRHRVFIIANAPDLPHYEFPIETHSKNALLRDQLAGTYWERHRRKTSKCADQPPREDNKRPWVTVRDALSKLPVPSISEAASRMNHWIIPGARVYPGHDGSKLDWPAKTIKAGVHGVPGGENTLIEDSGEIRYFTLRETALLQTFPNSHVFRGARLHITRQIGNAVPCVLSAAISLPLCKVLAEPEKECVR